MKPPECVDCGAFLQEVQIGAEVFHRCPWAKPDSWQVDGHQAIKRIYCGRPMGQKRIVGGITVESVR